jgi:hypothetical protein
MFDVQPVVDELMLNFRLGLRPRVGGEQALGNSLERLRSPGFKIARREFGVQERQPARSLAGQRSGPRTVGADHVGLQVRFLRSRAAGALPGRKTRGAACRVGIAHH